MWIGQRGGQKDITVKDIDYLWKTYEQGKQSSKDKKKIEANQLSALEIKRKKECHVKRGEQLAFEASKCSSDDDINALLKEEKDLVTYHKRQVKETIDIVKEEMNLLVEADQPGNHLDDYISKLNAILSQKAAGILELQTQLAQFQRSLYEFNVLVSSDN
ncbi:Kinesin-like protein [Quillaja saponaria]|uniref:Kinesin-like protein n=1 Tax=Quillaja saponaria TaxID=32244 RepID=A0AAD7M4K4_QUISA|nr:Kinesin-like protein [Quillaja saponaria]